MFIAGLIASLVGVCACRADVILGAPAGGPVTLHDGNFGIDLNGDAASDLQFRNGPAYGGTNLTILETDWLDVFQAIGVGVYRGSGSGLDAIAMGSGQTVGPTNGSNFVYSQQGLFASAFIHVYNASTSSVGGDPNWTDGQHHFLGVDVLAGTDHHYGWVELSLRDSGVATADQPWYDATVYDWAYETQPNQPITIPEPMAQSVAAVVGLAAAAFRTHPTLRRTVAISQGRES